MIKFIFGFIVGIFFAAGIYFYFSGDARLRIDIGQLLDQDAIYLKNGDILNGWILQEDKDNILIQVKEGTFSIPSFACIDIKRNIFMRYLRKLM